MAVHSRARDFDWCGSTKLPPLGLSSVRFIVNKYETDHRITAQQCVNEIDVDCAGNSDVVKFTGNVSVDDISDDEFGILVRDIPIWRRALWCFAIAFSKRIPSVSVGNFGAVAVATSLLAPRMITYFLVYPFCRLVFGTLYPAYASYKAVRTKNLKEYVKWMMYWIVFALFTCAETVTDVFLSWFPFYYEVKIVLVLWLLSPATKGSSILYRKFVHPALCRREQEIDEYISKAKEQGYHTVLNLGSKGVNYATTVIMQTAIKGGGGLVQQIKRSYSLSDLTEGDSRPQSQQDAIDEGDDVITEAKVIRRNTARSGYNTRRSASESNTRSAIYFSEVDVVDVRRKRISDPQDFNYIKSSEDISSGYSSAENSVAALSRTSSVGSKSRPRQISTRSTVTNIKRPAAAEESQVIIEELEDDEPLDYTKPVLNLPPNLHISKTNPPFLFEYSGNQINIIKVLNDNEFATFFGAGFPKDKNFVLNNDKVRKDKDVNDSNNIPFYENSEKQVQNSPDENAYESAEEESDENEFNENFVENIQCCKSHELQNTNEFSSCETDGETENVAVENIQCGKSHELQNTEFSSCETVGETELLDVKKKLSEDSTFKKFQNAQDVTTVDSVTTKYPVSDFLPTAQSKTCLKDSHTEFSEDQTETGKLSEQTKNNVSVMEIEANSSDKDEFNTPEDSPLSQRRLSKGGKYGKTKAPSPPKNWNNPDIVESNESSKFAKQTDDISSINSAKSENSSIVSDTASEHTKDKKSSEHLLSTGKISKKKVRARSKSPLAKSSSSALSKIMQIPGKLAFWNKADVKTSHVNEKSDTLSEISVQSKIEKPLKTKEVDYYQEIYTHQFHNIPKIIVTKPSGETRYRESFETTSFKDCIDLDEEITKDILDKSDVLQKLIDAKLVSHPEYKIVSLHNEETPTTSKSTEV